MSIWATKTRIIYSHEFMSYSDYVITCAIFRVYINVNRNIALQIIQTFHSYIIVIYIFLRKIYICHPRALHFSRDLHIRITSII